MKCSICSKEIILIPSAVQRANRYGGRAIDYTRLFTTHSHCSIAKYKTQVSELIQRGK